MDNETIMYEYSLIAFNKEEAKIANCISEYFRFDPEYGFWDVNCAIVDFSRAE